MSSGAEGAGYVNQQNAQRGSYAGVISQIAEERICPFCAEHLPRIHPNPLAIHEYWTVTDNAYPYTPVRHQVLFIHRQHIAHVQELSAAAWQELQLLCARVCQERNISGGTLVMRFGDTRFTGASVQHLHAQLVQGDPDDPAYDVTRGVLCRVG